MEYDVILVTADGAHIGAFAGTTEAIEDAFGGSMGSLYRVVAYEGNVASCATSVQAQAPCAARRCTSARALNPLDLGVGAAASSVHSVLKR